MMKSLRRSIGIKILALVGFVTLLNLSGMVMFYANNEEKFILMQHEKNIQDLTAYVSKGLQTVMLSGNAEIAQAFGNSLTSGTVILDFFILRPNGVKAFQDNKTILDINTHLGSEVFKPRGVEQEVRILEASDLHLAEVRNTRKMVSFPTKMGDVTHRTFLVPIPNDEQCHGCHTAQDTVRGVLQLSTSLEAMQQMLADTRTRAVRVLIIAVILSLVSIYLLIRVSVVKPVRSISEAMVQVANGNYGQSVPVVGENELSVMAQQFNRMSIEIQKSHQGISQERNKLTTIIHSAREAIVVTDDQDTVVLVNPSAERLLDKTSDHIIEEGFFQLVDEPEYIKKFLAGKGVDLPETLVYKHRVLSFYAATITNNRGKKVGSAALIRDVTSEKKLEAQLREMSYTDKLTGLHNRRWMEQALTNEFSRATRYQTSLSLLFFDVDHFKRFNDTYGHDLGDRVLARLGELATSCFRDLDFPCRYGGEEFCIILTNTNSAGAAKAAEAFRQQVADMLVDNLHVTISIGVSNYPEADIKSPEELLKLADNALYEGKRAGRNRVVLWKDVLT